ncbi:MAG TPA: LD-carboxypeptidase [Agriterribacter sp.]|nr:LD-carboxypeptidase [Agriterribacter sp.]
MIQIPPSLKKGDTIGITCPAGFMEIKKVQTCIESLEQWGYHVEVGNTVGGKSKTYFSGTDEERLTELQKMLDDKNIKAILCGRGGYGTGRIIEQINFKKFRKHPKWIIGFSDITVLHAHIYSNYKIASLHAPMAAAFNDGGFKNEFVQSLKKALEGKAARYTCKINPLNIKGKASGELVGGNLSLLAHITGTSSDIETKGKILFMEEIGEYLYSVDRMLYQLKRSGKLNKLAGLVVGGFTDMKDTERPFGKGIFEIIHDLVKEYDYPVCMGFPVSHNKDNYALKVGVVYQLNVETKRVVLEEKMAP